MNKKIIQKKKKKKKIQEKIIKDGLTDLKDEIEKMSEDEKRLEQPDEIVDLAEKVLKYN